MRSHPICNDRRKPNGEKWKDDTEIDQNRIAIVEWDAKSNLESGNRERERKKPGWRFGDSDDSAVVGRAGDVSRRRIGVGFYKSET